MDFSASLPVSSAALYCLMSVHFEICAIFICLGEPYVSTHFPRLLALLRHRSSGLESITTQCGVNSGKIQRKSPSLIIIMYWMYELFPLQKFLNISEHKHHTYCSSYWMPNLRVSIRTNLLQGYSASHVSNVKLLRDKFSGQTTHKHANASPYLQICTPIASHTDTHTHSGCNQATNHSHRCNTASYLWTLLYHYYFKIFEYPWKEWSFHPNLNRNYYKTSMTQIIMKANHDERIHDSVFLLIHSELSAAWHVGDV